MKNYLMIECPIEKLIPFLRRFSYLSHIAISGAGDTNIHYLGFDSRYAFLAACEFAQTNDCHVEEVTRDEVLRRFNADTSLKISPHSNFDPLVDRL